MAHSTAVLLGLHVPEGFKCCSYGFECRHPDGCILPATTDYFYKNSQRKDGLSGDCKVCHNTLTKQWDSAHPVQRRAISDSWKKRNPDKTAAQARKWRKKNPQRARELDRRCIRSLDLVKAKIRSHRRMARKRNLPNTFTHDDWQHALNYFNGCCAVCGRQLTDLFTTHKAHADHWIPLNDAFCPGSVATNIVPLCGGLDGCNQSKGSKLPNAWLIERFGKRKAEAILIRVKAYFDNIRAA